MNAERHLERVQLLDCTGAASHTMTLRIDGMVEVRFRAGHVAVVDPVAKVTLTRGMTVPPDVIEAAAGLRPSF